MAWTGGQYAVTTGAVKLTTALGFASNVYIKQIDVRYASGAGASSFVYLGKSTVTNVPANAFVELGPAQAWSKTEGGAPNPLSTDEIYVVGTAAAAANIIFVDIIT
jgi:hypothetical protein